MKYQHIVIDRFGGPEVLRLVDESGLPEPNAGEVRVKVIAAGTGFTDTIVRRGNYVAVKQKPPLTPGYDFVGVVDKLGAGVDSLRVGQTVADMPVIGGYTQYIVRPANRLVPVPDGVDPVEAVCMPLSFLTAHQMITRVAQLRRGQSILIHGASGAAGSAMLVLGAQMGLKMYGSCHSRKFPLLERYGCIPIDYRNEDFEARIRALPGGGVDVVFDAIGGDHWARSYRCLKRGGLLVGYGAQNIAKNDDSVFKVLLGFFKLMAGWKLVPDGRRTAFYNIQSRREKIPAEFDIDLRALFELLREGAIKPIVAGTYPLSAAQEVHRLIDAGDVVGKIVLLPF